MPDTSQTRRVAGRHVAKHASWRLASVTRMSEAKSGADFSHSRKPRPSLNASADTSLMRRLANRNPLFTLRRRQASLTIEPLHQSFAVSVSALFSGSERNSPQQIDQRRGVRCTTKTKSRAFLAACGCASGTTGTTELEARKGLHGPCVSAPADTSLSLTVSRIQRMDRVSAKRLNPTASSASHIEP